MDKYGLSIWFIIAVVLSAIPLLKEYSQVQKSYQYVKRPHHRHHRVPVLGDFEPPEQKKSHKAKRDKAILESNKDYEDEEDILVGHTTTVQPVIMKRVRKKAQSKAKEAISTCGMQIAETLPASVFSPADLAENHLPMHDVRMQFTV